PDGKISFNDSGDWDAAKKPHPGRIVMVEKNGKAKILEELDHVYPNGIVAEPDGSIIWVESYTLKVVRRTPDGKKKGIHTLAEGHIPDGLKIDVNGRLWITTVASGGVDILNKDGSHHALPHVGGTILTCVLR